MTEDPGDSFDVLEWYYIRENERGGPVSESDLRRMLRDSTLEPDALIWRPGLSAWTPAPSVLPALADGGRHTDAVGGPVYFPVSTAKVVVMSLTTWGLYELYWFYRNWKAVKDREGLKISPFWRAWFAIFHCHGLFTRIKVHAQSRGVFATYNPAWLAAAYIVLLLSARLPVIGLVSILSFWPLLPVVGVIRTLNESAGGSSFVETRYSVWDIIGIVLGSLLWLAVIASYFVPLQN